MHEAALRGDEAALEAAAEALEKQIVIIYAQVMLTPPLLPRPLLAVLAPCAEGWAAARRTAVPQACRSSIPPPSIPASNWVPLCRPL